MTRVTAELVQKLHGCQKGIDFMLQHYPDGADCMDLIQDDQVPDDFLHWGFTYLRVTPDEIDAYKKRLGINNSEMVFFSKNVDNSKYVLSSEDVKNSKDIDHCNQILDSLDISKSFYITSSRYIQDSKYISDSSYLKECLNDTNIKNAYKANGCLDSSNLYMCSGIEDSMFLINCSNLYNSFFCFLCNNTGNLFFCFGLQPEKEDKETYYLFNKPVSMQYFKSVKKQLLPVVKNYLMPIFINDLNDTTAEHLLIHQTDYRKLYNKKLLNTIYDFAPSLKGYDKKVLDLSLIQFN